jgi:hypothetical protein
MRKHFGTAPIHAWLEFGNLKEYYPGFSELSESKQKEVENAHVQASSGLFVRVWEEVTEIFLHYLKHSCS